MAAATSGSGTRGNQGGRMKRDMDLVRKALHSGFSMPGLPMT